MGIEVLCSCTLERRSSMLMIMIVVTHRKPSWSRYQSPRYAMNARNHEIVNLVSSSEHR